MTSPSDPMQNVKAGMKAMWMAGDFGEIAKRNEEEAEAFVARLGLKPGQRLLDVACGTGNTAIPAARMGCHVTGVDIATNLLEQARERAKAEGLSSKTEFLEGDAEKLQFGDGQFDAVITMYGAMFAPRPELVARELMRVCKPAGLIAMANWTPGGFVGEIFRMSAKRVPPPPGIPAPVLWGDERTARQRFEAATRELGIDKVGLEFHKRMHVMRPEEGPAEMVEFFIKYFGPTKVAFSKLDHKGQEAFRKELVDLWSKYNESSSGSAKMLVNAEYLEVIAHRG